MVCQENQHGKKIFALYVSKELILSKNYCLKNATKAQLFSVVCNGPTKRSVGDY
jgi:hypothetical protein